MFRFKLYFKDYMLVSSEFKDYNECCNIFDNLYKVLSTNGGMIEEFINGIGWVIYE